MQPPSDDTADAGPALAAAARGAGEPRRRLEDSFFDVAIDMLCLLGFDGYFRRLNPAWEETLGFTREPTRKPYRGRFFGKGLPEGCLSILAQEFAGMLQVSLMDFAVPLRSLEVHGRPFPTAPVGGGGIWKAR